MGCFRKPKPKSKIVPLKKQKRVEHLRAERRRKLKRLLKKDPTIRRSRRKNPGIPSTWPFKLELLEQITKQKSESSGAKKQRKREKSCLKRERQSARKLMEEDEIEHSIVAAQKEVRAERTSRLLRRMAQWDDSALEETPSKPESLEELMAKAEAANARVAAGRSDDIDAAASKPRNITRHFAPELRKVVDKADVILEVLDARDPEACRSPKLEAMVKEAGRRLVFVLNKVDLIPRDVAKAWVGYLRGFGPTIAFKCALGAASRANISKTSTLAASDGHLKATTHVLGMSALLSLLKNFARVSPESKIKKAIVIGVVGYPNVGKSSLINAMARSVDKCAVGGAPGVTRKLQEVPLDANISFIDSPGVILDGDPNSPEHVLRNGVLLTNATDPHAAVEYLISKSPTSAIMRFYEVPSYSSVDEFIASFARSRGKIQASGVPNVDAACRQILADWHAGKVRYYSLPPKSRSEVSTQSSDEPIPMDVGEDNDVCPRLVESFAPEFDITALCKENDDEVMKLRNLPGKGFTDFNFGQMSVES